MANFSMSDYQKIVECCGFQSRTIQSTKIDSAKNGFLELQIIIENHDLKLLVSPKSRFHKILFEDFQDNIPNFSLKSFPELCYQNSDFLVFKNLENFRICCSLDLEHLQLTLKVLADFHSKTLIFEEFNQKQVAEEYDLTCRNVDTNRILEILSFTKIEDTASVVEKFHEIEHAAFRKTLTHGNLSQENLLFEYQDDRPINCKLLNFREEFRPPICDVLQLIFLNTCGNFRQENFWNLLDFYYQCFKTNLEAQFLNIENLFSLEEMKKSAHHFLPVAKLEKAFSQTAESVQELEEILLCPIISREDCFSIIGKIEENFKFVSFRVSPLDQVNGYLGSYHKLKINYVSQSEKTINCFVKTMPRNNSSKNIVAETGCFSKEIFIYEQLVPQLKKSEIEIIADCLPISYLHRLEEIVIFEDLTLKNYRSLKAQNSYSFSLLALAVRKLAKFHASTLIFEERMSKHLGRLYRLGEEYRSSFQEIFFSEENHSGAVLMQVGLRSIPCIIDLFPDLKTEENLKQFESKWPQLQNFFFEAIKPSRVFRNVVCHGDLWTNNIMVKLENDNPVDCLFVDFQCTRYCPPAHDFLSVVFLTTDRQTRLQFEDDMKTIYYQELKQILHEFGLQAEKLMSFAEFCRSVEFMKPQMILQALTYKSFTLCTPEEISSFLVSDEVSSYVFFNDRKEYLETVSKRSPVMQNALRECIIDLFELCENWV